MSASWLKIDCGTHGKVLAAAKEYEEVQKVAAARLECASKDVRLYITESGEDDLWEIDKSAWGEALGLGQVILARTGPTPDKHLKTHAKDDDSGSVSEDGREVDMLLEDEEQAHPDSFAGPSSIPPSQHLPIATTLQLSKNKPQNSGQLRPHFRSVSERRPTPAPAGFRKGSKVAIHAPNQPLQGPEKHAWTALGRSTTEIKSTRRIWDSKTHRELFSKLKEVLDRSPPDRSRKYMAERTRIFGILMSQWGDKGTRGKFLAGRSLDALTTRVSGVIRHSRTNGNTIPDAFDFLFPPNARQKEAQLAKQRQKEREELAKQQKKGGNKHQELEKRLEMEEQRLSEPLTKKARKKLRRRLEEEMLEEEMMEQGSGNQPNAEPRHKGQTPASSTSTSGPRPGHAPVRAQTEDPRRDGPSFDRGMPLPLQREAMQRAAKASGAAKTRRPPAPGPPPVPPAQLFRGNPSQSDCAGLARQAPPTTGRASPATSGGRAAPSHLRFKNESTD